MTLSGQNVNLIGAELSALQMSLLAAGNVTGSSASLDAGGLYVEAGNNIDLLTSQITIGSGFVSGIVGDSAVIAAMNNLGLPLPAGGNPNAKLQAGGTLSMGNTTVTSSNAYLWFSADTLVLNPVSAPVSANLLMQYSPLTATNTIGMEDFPEILQTGLAQQESGNDQMTSYTNSDHIEGFPMTTIVIGSSLQSGNMTLGGDGSVDIGSKNIIFIGSGNVDSIENVISTGIVSRGGFVAFTEEIFIPPVLADIDVNRGDNTLLIDEEERNRQVVTNQTDESGMCMAL
jgi:hypothetical protein